MRNNYSTYSVQIVAPTKLTIDTNHFCPYTIVYTIEQAGLKKKHPAKTIELYYSIEKRQLICHFTYFLLDKLSSLCHNTNQRTKPSEPSHNIMYKRKTRDVDLSSLNIRCPYRHYHIVLS